jgi:hypothetical protein
MFKEALANIWTIDAASIIGGVHQPFGQRRRMLVMLEGQHADRSSVPDFNPISSPMGRGSDKAVAHGESF